MRRMSAAIMAVLLSFSAMGAFTDEQQQLADQLLSGDLGQLKSASQRIFKEGIKHPELSDIAAEILLVKYPDAYSSEVDSLAWLARAIGSTENGRYHGVLSEVVNSTKIDKLARHAEKALDNLPGAEGEQYIAGMYTLPKGVFEKETTSELVARLKKLMLRGDLASLKRAAKEIVSTKTVDQTLTDIVAEALLLNYPAATKAQIDTLAWLTNAIGSTGLARYKQVLQQVEDNSDFRKLRKYAEKNKAKLADEEVEQYQQGMLKLPLPAYTY
ncbi:hypothetical protein [Alteromonas gilva]|uniref:HEAT repeat domain-containing protein n=1 Tax=Alteromonas gilva TaxID=2987522 RepID=A0ABT5KXF2_9ALTE|nr:hypothetical protein [Alteromonas gilva]MDC8829450.1 hypothetical protein [Alteromonas gilva]